MSARPSLRWTRILLWAALVGAVPPLGAAAQERGVTGEVGAQVDLVRLRFFDGGTAFAYYEGRGTGVFARARYGMLGLEGRYTRGDLRPEGGTAGERPSWQASARLALHVSPWLSLEAGPEAWHVDGAPAFDVVAWMLGAAVEVPLVRGVATGHGAFSASVFGDVGSFGTLSNGAVAEIGVALADSNPLSLSAAYRISRHAWAGSIEGSHRLEELELRVGVRLR